MFHHIHSIVLLSPPNTFPSPFPFSLVFEDLRLALVIDLCGLFFITLQCFFSSVYTIELPPQCTAVVFPQHPTPCRSLRVTFPFLPFVPSTSPQTVSPNRSFSIETRIYLTLGSPTSDLFLEVFPSHTPPQVGDVSLKDDTSITC